MTFGATPCENYILSELKHSKVLCDLKGQNFQPEISFYLYGPLFMTFGATSCENLVLSELKQLKAKIRPEWSNLS